jgi:Protein of unknown function (DUF2946)
MIRARFRRLAGIALVALLAATLAPSIAHALQTSPLAVAGLGVCGVPGTPQGAAGALDGHCPLCTVAGDPLLPTATAAISRATPCRSAAPSAANPPPARLRAWSPAHARAPPASSI